MQVKNIELNIYIDFLSGMTLPNKASLGRTKLIEAFRTHLKEFGEDQINIIDEFDAWKNKDEGTYHNDVPKLNDAMATLQNDDVEIEFKSPFKKDFIGALENYDGELSGADAEVYANLYENLVEELEGTQTKEEK